ncbi:MAG: putative small methyltransferase [Candidatus Methanohalarchaeum thermophilum]|uniref:UPF0146 protein BTN85_1215 n=1 Tax=Methanohalarchaeum thermophilum TaxID=1903181 RepID=A0A1Q6DWJ0_METT1|nr:MAG: putative small methyltransferase [Candidatus Methanohalarchaeum thermophilum]
MKSELDLVAEYIVKEYNDANKIVEIGIGNEKRVYTTLSKLLDSKLLAVDLYKNYEFVKKDDVFDPDLDLYQGTNLIYAIRPPIEIQKPISEICKKVQSHLLIKPIQNEIQDLSQFFQQFHLKNIKKTAVYLGKNPKT